MRVSYGHAMARRGVRGASAASVECPLRRFWIKGCPREDVGTCELLGSPHQSEPRRITPAPDAPSRQSFSLMR